PALGVAKRVDKTGGHVAMRQSCCTVGTAEIYELGLAAHDRLTQRSLGRGGRVRRRSAAGTALANHLGLRWHGKSDPGSPETPLDLRESCSGRQDLNLRPLDPQSGVG